MADNITYTDKAQGQVSTEPVNKRWNFGDANEVKSVVNSHAVEIESNIVDININTGKVLDNQIKVNQANLVATLGGVIDSTKEYFIDGIVDFTGLSSSIEIPSTGIEVKGYSFDTSGIICSDAAYTLFNSPVGGSGNILLERFFIQIDGVTSKVYDIVGNTGFEAVEVEKINFNNCTSLGEVDNYRQGLESGTGRFGGTPELTLSGAWLGGYFITTSIVRSLADGAYSLFKAGVGLTMASRFRSNANIDLPALPSYLDFAPSNFLNPSTLQLIDSILTRNGATDPEGVNITPNITSSDLASYWKGNNGLNNTHVGGKSTITTEVETVITTVNVYKDLLGTYTASDLQHFDSPANGQLRHLGSNPRDYKVTAHVDIDGGSGDNLEMSVQKWDDSASIFVEIDTQIRVVNNFQGGRDVSFFNIITNTSLDQNDFIKIQIRNITDTTNVTGELGGYFLIEER